MTSQVTTRSDGVRPLRSDAARNLRLIHRAALDVISEHGTEASMEQIAHRAGVGVGTLYRRFPNKEALVEALVDGILTDLIGAARDALKAPEGTGLERFLHHLGGSFVLYRGWASQLLGRAEPSSCADVLRALVAQLLEQAKEHRKVAPHVTTSDIQLTMWSLRGVVESTAPVAPKAWIRFLDLHLAGLRVEPSPTMRPPMTKAQLAAIASQPH